MKFKITVIQTRVFETELSDYGGEAKNEDEALAIERASAMDDASLFVDHPDTETTIVMEVVKE